jgi:glyoxylase-like metal-dependent hydrolase (beta-lactamase superfamily II)
MQLQVEAFFHEPTNTASYVIRDSQSHACAIVDSVLDFDAASGRTSTASAEAIASYVEGQGLRCEWILETHVHADHLSAAPYLKERLKSKIGIGVNITIVQNVFGMIFNAGTEFQRDGSQFDALFDDGAEIVIGTLRGRAIHTPGHTPASMTYIFGDAAFIGDTLFILTMERRVVISPAEMRACFISRSRSFSRCRHKPASLFVTIICRLAGHNIAGKPRSHSKKRTIF